MLAYILQGLVLGFSAGISPGPLQTFFLSQTLKNGWKRTLPAAFAPLLSDGPIIVLVLLILTNLPGSFLAALKIGGGIFIILIGLRTLIGLRNAAENVIQPDQKNTSLRDATVMNLLNPSPYIFWSTLLGPILIQGWRASPALGIGFIGGFYVMVVACFAGLIVLFGTAQHLNPRFTRWLSGLAGAGLLVFGVYQVWSGLWNG